MQIITEVCVESRSGARFAQAAGAHRIELCSELACGGVTPSPGLLESTLELGLPVVVLVRPRSGDFAYDADEIDQVTRDIHFAVRAGAAGVAVGALTPAGTIDLAALQPWMEAAQGAEVCFHRAFDGLADPDAGLEILVEQGVTRLLSSGGQSDVVAGLEALTRWQQVAGSELEIMPGGGVRADNIAQVARESGCPAIHFSARVPQPSRMQHFNPKADLHAPESLGRKATDETEIRRYLDALRAR